MKFSEQWLREWVNPDVSTAELCEQFTMAGLEVDSVEPAAPSFDGVVVGHVLKVTAHPDADKLRVCEVSVGKGTPLQVVCGAPNVKEDMRVPFAQVGAYLPGDMKIKRAKLRGVESEGMLCSAKELGLSDDASGLMALPEDAPAGEDLRKYLNLDDQLIEIDLTPNRGDCLGMIGVARESGVLNRCDVTVPEIKSIKAKTKEKFDIKIEAPEDCPRYIGRIITGIDNSVKTPDWLIERLRRSGLNSISPVVDVTNYVLLELGQPMHAFDLQKLNKGIKVRHTKDKEKLILLDGKEVSLTAGTLVIADHKRPLAIAGVMGGEDSGVIENTTSILLESAFFTPDAIIGKARSYSLHTDSSYRFERGVDPEMQKRAIERATALLLDIVGGEAGPVMEEVSKKHLPARSQVKLRRARITQVLGITLSDDDVSEILTRLGMKITSLKEGWKVTPPSYRFDIELEVDLIEELGRIYGYSRIKSKQPETPMHILPVSEKKIEMQRIRSVLVDRGYEEAITYSFVEPELQKLLIPKTESVELANPISSDMSVMRTSLWPGLIQAASYNQNRQQPRIRLFETGLIFQQQKNAIVQENRIAGIALGEVITEQWGENGRTIDFYDVKADVEALLELGGAANYRFEADTCEALHPGQSARIHVDGKPAGWLGVLHPSVTQAVELTGNPVIFELRLDAIMQANVAKFVEISKFPSIRRDIAIIVDEQITAQSVQECVENSAGYLLNNVVLFDMYQGKGIDSGRKSLALGLTLGDSSRTLMEEDVEAVLGKVVSALNTNLGAVLRD